MAQEGAEIFFFIPRRCASATANATEPSRITGRAQSMNRRKLFSIHGQGGAGRGLRRLLARASAARADSGRRAAKLADPAVQAQPRHPARRARRNRAADPSATRARRRAERRHRAHRRHGLRRVERLWRSVRHADCRAAGDERSQVHPLSHHGALLADPAGAADRAQPSFGQHGRHHASSPRDSPATPPSGRTAPPPSRRR